RHTRAKRDWSSDVCPSDLADALLADNGVPRHFIGRLQTNKARDVVAFAGTIHSVDREGIVDALERRAEMAGVQRDVLVQVNTSRSEERRVGKERERREWAG